VGHGDGAGDALLQGVSWGGYWLGILSLQWAEFLRPNSRAVVDWSCFFSMVNGGGGSAAAMNLGAGTALCFMAFKEAMGLAIACWLS